MNVPPTAQRVQMRTNPKILEKIRNQTIGNLKGSMNKSEPELTEKINNLNAEWDTERVLETHAAVLVIVSTILGAIWNKLWYLVTVVVGVFLLQHALDGWCPPLPCIRKMGVRTAEEINHEKIVLKMMRGDFTQGSNDIDEMLNVAQKQ
ncbi:MAG: hypothetical protein K0S47_3241 [Herbinix sp.]|nr:hypothetical protein [Herbinix sp.]